MTEPRSKSKPTWSDVKAKLAGLDRQGLLDLIQDLHAAHIDNRTFLYTRFGLREDVLEPYKETIDRWLWPDVFRKQDVSVAKAKQAVTDYKKAGGEPGGLAELMVFFCEQAVGFSVDVGLDDEVYLRALVRMFDQALAAASQLPAGSRDPLLARLKKVWRASRRLGYGIEEYLSDALGRYGVVEDGPV